MVYVLQVSGWCNACQRTHIAEPILVTALDPLRARRIAEETHGPKIGVNAVWELKAERIG
jgi:hypothetical protein